MSSVISLQADWPGTTGERWSMITSADQGRKREWKKDKCYHGNRDLALNIPLTVIEEGWNELHQHVSLYVTVSSSLTRKCLRQLMLLLCSACVCVCVWGGEMYAGCTQHTFVLRERISFVLPLYTLSLCRTWRPSVAYVTLFICSWSLCVCVCMLFPACLSIFCSPSLWQSSRRLLLNFSGNNRVSCASIAFYNMNHASLAAHLSCFCLPCVTTLKNTGSDGEACQETGMFLPEYCKER